MGEKPILIIGEKDYSNIIESERKHENISISGGRIHQKTKVINFPFWFFLHANELSEHTHDEVIDKFISASIFCGISDSARKELREYIEDERKMQKARKESKAW